MINEITANDLSKSFRSVLVIDVRETNEYESGHVPGAVNIPLSGFAQRLGEVPKTEAVFMICRSGARSMQACELCLDNGYENVMNISDGTIGWINHGYEISLGGQKG